MTLLFICLAGGIGALLRFLIDGLIRTGLGRSFPWGTLLINVSGSFLLGLMTGLLSHQQLSQTIVLILGTGLLGGYTTFSTVSFETVRLIEGRRYMAALANAGGTLVVTLLAAGIGLVITL